MRSLKTDNVIDFNKNHNLFKSTTAYYVRLIRDILRNLNIFRMIISNL